MAIRESDYPEWPDTLSPVRQSLRAIARECVRQSRALSTEEAVEAAELHSKPSRIFAREKLLSIMEQCRDRGLLLVSPIIENVQGDEWTWEPANQVISDYLLAEEAYSLAKENLNAAVMPKYLEQRPDSQAMVVALLGSAGHRFFDSNLWEKSLTAEEREILQLDSFVMLPRQRAIEYQDFVSALLVRNMPNCRRVLAAVVVPNIRNPGWPFGARFIHDQLTPFKVADRDLFWSGPRRVPVNHGGIWEGTGIPVLETLKTEADDPWDTTPLLLSWATTTVDNIQRRSYRAEIARWARNQPEGLLQLVQAATSTNDPQMMEDILSATYGAACLTHPNAAWKTLAEWLIERFFSKKALLQTDNVVVRHSARGTVERALFCGVKIDTQRLQTFRSHYVASRRLLPLSIGAVNQATEGSGAPPATSDLAWYVVPGSVDRFFEPISKGASWGRDQRTVPRLEDISEKILLQFVDGASRKGAGIFRRRFAKAALVRINRKKDQERARQAELKEHVRHLTALMMATIPGPDSEEDAVTFASGEAVSAPHDNFSLPKRAEMLLRRHAASLGLEALSHRQLAFGFVTAFAQSLGWDYDRFRGQPMGGSSGEILGPDTAIRRRYRPETHGGRSDISTFAEKYVWLATHELQGYLADRLALSLDGELVSPPVDPSLITEVTNPAVDLVQAEPNGIWAGFLPPQLTPQIQLTRTVQVECANEWVEKAPLPDIQPILFPGKDLLPIWAQNDEWVLLRAVITAVDPNSQGSTILLVSCSTFNTKHSSILYEDAKSSSFLEYLHDFSSGIQRAASYVDPNEAAWAPWLREAYGLHRHVTLDDNAFPIFLDFKAASCRIYWDTVQSESEMFIPAEVLRRTLKLSDFRAELRGGRFSNIDGTDLSFFHRSGSDGWVTPFSQVLFVRRSAFESALRNAGLAPCWSTRIQRQPSTPLLQKGWPRTTLDWSGLSLFIDDKLETVEIHRLLKKN